MKYCNNYGLLVVVLDIHSIGLNICALEGMCSGTIKYMINKQLIEVAH